MNTGGRAGKEQECPCLSCKILGFNPLGTSRDWGGFVLAQGSAGHGRKIQDQNSWGRRAWLRGLGVPWGGSGVGKWDKEGLGGMG